MMLQQLASKQAKADQIIQDAQAEAELILATAAAKIARQEKAGYEAGWDTGLEAGIKQAKAEWQTKMDEVELLRQRLVAADDAWLAGVGPETIQLALAVVERVVACKLQKDDAVLQAALRQVLATAKGVREAHLTVAVEDFPEIWARRTEWRSLLPGVKDFSVETDDELQNGDLVLVTNQGTIDARVDTLLDQVAAQLSVEELS